MSRGLFVVLAGIDGSGKTTQASRLAAWFRDGGRETVLTRAPGATPIGLEMRRLLLRDRIHEGVGTEAMMFMVDRAEHVEKVVAPALARGAVVVCDRYTESTLAYQAPGLPGDGEATILAIHDAMGWPHPDLTLHLRVDPAIAQARIAARGGEDRDPDGARLANLAATYDRLIDGRRGAAARVDADGDEDEVHVGLVAAVVRHMARKAVAA